VESRDEVASLGFRDDGDVALEVVREEIGCAVLAIYADD
jgi:hypothetical protein